MEIFRLFAAIKPPEDIIRDLTKLQKGIVGARWSDPEKLHVTLGFFGDVAGEQAEVLDMELAKIKRSSFELSLSGVGHYGKNEPRSIWAGVDESSTLTHLHKAVKNAGHRAGVEMERRDYRPHATLAYFGAFPDIEALAKFEHHNSGFKTIPFLVDQFFLYSSSQRKSGGNVYKAEASYPLLGGAS